MKDIHLWEQFKNGDRQALETIFRLHIKVLYKYGNKFSANRQLVEDCIQDLFLELWGNKKTLGGTDAIRPYLFSALRRKIIRHLQKHHKMINDHIEPESYCFVLEENGEELLINHEKNQEKNQQLSIAMKQLSTREREAIYLKYYQHLSYEEIAQTMEVNYQSVRNLIYRALKRLRTSL
ncbi:RNA polymerase sigma factor [Xanthovirga aplysinae]|uniref:RNA polymerase sigma factor n=1 Tax=Xanthovirga aplysinae TaxID=2529853 RepID=UPI0012BB8922|nr:RNA polymerase sigma factor [Xanthovirga aplysinae]MTI32227.1 RNA polymerase sigma factor [Xanthovirga aplysinae]